MTKIPNSVGLIAGPKKFHFIRIIAHPLSSLTLSPNLNRKGEVKQPILKSPTTPLKSDKVWNHDSKQHSAAQRLDSPNELPKRPFKNAGPATCRYHSAASRRSEDQVVCKWGYVQHQSSETRDAKHGVQRVSSPSFASRTFFLSISHQRFQTFERKRKSDLREHTTPTQAKLSCHQLQLFLIFHYVFRC
jgi:hypothetical protein